MKTWFKAIRDYWQRFMKLIEAMEFNENNFQDKFPLP